MRKQTSGLSFGRCASRGSLRDGTMEFSSTRQDFAACTGSFASRAARFWRGQSLPLTQVRILCRRRQRVVCFAGFICTDSAVASRQRALERWLFVSVENWRRDVEQFGWTWEIQDDICERSDLLGKRAYHDESGKRWLREFECFGAGAIDSTSLGSMFRQLLRVRRSLDAKFTSIV